MLSRTTAVLRPMLVSRPGRSKTAGTTLAAIALVGLGSLRGVAGAQSSPEPTLPQAFGSEIVSTEQAVAALNAKNTKVAATAAPVSTIAVVSPASTVAVVVVTPPSTVPAAPAASAKKKSSTKRRSAPSTTSLVRLLPSDTETPTQTTAVAAPTPTTRPVTAASKSATTAGTKATLPALSKKAADKEAPSATTSNSSAAANDSEAKAVAPASSTPSGKSDAVPAKSSDDALAANLAALRKCESGGRYTTNTGNGYYGAYQFALSTWRALGYSGYPHEAAPEVQDEAARKLLKKAGWGQWPACSRKLGLR